MRERIRSGNTYMCLERFSNRIIAYYSQGEVLSIEVINGAFCQVTVTYKNGELFNWESNKIYYVALCMYGIAISKDGKYFFAQQDMNGLICLDLKNGNVVWKTKSKAEISHIFVCNKTLCCSKSRNEIQLIDISNGIVIISHKCTFDNRFEVLNEKMILNHSYAKKWEVLNPESLKVVETITQKELDNDQNKDIWKRLYKDWR